MTPKDISEALKPYGHTIARSTLTQYARVGVIGAPETRSLGRGRGVLSRYPLDAPAEIVATRSLVGTTLNGERITLEALAHVREVSRTHTTGELAQGVEGVSPWHLSLMGEWLARRAWVLYGFPMVPQADIADLLRVAEPNKKALTLYDALGR